MKSKFLRLGIADLAKGAVVTIFFSLSTTLLISGMTIKQHLLTSAAALLSYLAKNILTNDKDELLKK
jgi:hypothetical protein